MKMFIVPESAFKEVSFPDLVGTIIAATIAFVLRLVVCVYVLRYLGVLPPAGFWE